MTQFLFTTQDLLDLINNSTAVRSLQQDELVKLLGFVNNPQLPAAQNLYAALQQEKQQYEKIDKATIAETNRLFNSYDLELTSMKRQALQSKTEEAEKDYAAVEKKTAKKLLKSLKQK